MVKRKYKFILAITAMLLLLGIVYVLLDIHLKNKMSKSHDYYNCNKTRNMLLEIVYYIDIGDNIGVIIADGDYGSEVIMDRMEYKDILEIRVGRDFFFQNGKLFDIWGGELMARVSNGRVERIISRGLNNHYDNCKNDDIWITLEDKEIHEGEYWVK